MTESRQLLHHFLAALAYRTQKALRGAPEHFASFRVGPMSENVIFAQVRAENVSANQSEPAAPDAWWKPEDPPRTPGTVERKHADEPEP